MIAESPGDGGADIVRHSEQRRAEALDDLAPFVAELDFGDLRRMVRRCRIESQRPIEAAPSHRRGSARHKDRRGFRSDRARAVRRSADKSRRSEEHTSELQSLMRISYAVFCLKKKKKKIKIII